MEVGVSLEPMPVHRHIVVPGHPCSLRMHSADASDVLNSNNAAVSAFRHVHWNKRLEADVRVCVVGLRHTLVYKTLREGPVW